MERLEEFQQELSQKRFELKTHAKRKFDEISLNEMASRCLKMLENSPDPARGYECRFSNGMLGIPWHYPLCPPNKQAFDPVSLGDTDIRMLMAFPYMREMAQKPALGDTEKGLWKRIEGYMSAEGACMAGAQAFSGEPVSGEWVCLWGSSHTVIAYCDAFERTGEESFREKAVRGVEFWLKIANRKDDMLYFKYGNAPFRKGRWLKIGWAEAHRRNYPYILTALLRVYRITGEEKYLRCAEAFGRGILASVQKNMRELAVQDDGSFRGHVPVHTKMLAGMAMLGQITKNEDFIDFAYKCYSYIVRMGTDFGWYPEYIPPEQNLRSEMCVTGDMLETCYYLARCGYPEEYDRAERTYRNYMQSSQFFRTEEFKNLYFSLHAGDDAEAAVKNFESMRVMEGGFVAQLSINDYITNFEHLGRRGLNENGFQMMGCCQGAGMSGLYYLYRMLCEKRADGIYVNMSLTADTEHADIVSDYASEKKLRIVCKESGTYFIRLPEWTRREDAALWRNGTKTEPTFAQNGYIRVPDAARGEEICVGYPIACFTQTWVPQVKNTGETYTVEWQGNTVAKISPKGRFLSIYD